MRGGKRINAGRKPKYSEKTESLTFKVPSSKKEEISQRFEVILSEYSLKSINDLIEMGYLFELLDGDWWLLTVDREKIIGFSGNEPSEAEKEERHYSVNSKKEIVSIFL